MRLMNRILWFASMAVLFASAQQAPALPSSTFGSANGWQGYTFYNENGFDLVIQFNVYDTVANPTEFIWQATGIDMPDTDRYVYAYQIFSNPTTSTKDIGSFTIMHEDGSGFASSAIHATTGQDDPSTAADLLPAPLVSGIQGKWFWASDTDYLAAGSRSSFLIFSSPYAPVKGDFELKTPDEEGDFPSPHNGVPEPGMVMLTTLGTAVLMRKRRSRVAKR